MSSFHLIRSWRRNSVASLGYRPVSIIIHGRYLNLGLNTDNVIKTSLSLISVVGATVAVILGPIWETQSTLQQQTTNYKLF